MRSDPTPKVAGIPIDRIPNRHPQVLALATEFDVRVADRLLNRQTVTPDLPSALASHAANILTQLIAARLIAAAHEWAKFVSELAAFAMRFEDGDRSVEFLALAVELRRDLNAAWIPECPPRTAT